MLSLIEWHGCLDHTNTWKLKTLLTHKSIRLNIGDKSVIDYEVLLRANFVKEGFWSCDGDWSTRALKLIHWDVWSYSEGLSGDYSMIFTWVDDALECVWIYPIKDQADMWICFKDFLFGSEQSTGIKLRRLWSDNGGGIHFTKIIWELSSIKGYSTWHGSISFTRDEWSSWEMELKSEA